MRIVVYDLETKNSPVTSADWKRWDWMGISVGCAYDFSTGEYTVYLDDNLPALIDLLNSADLVAAFNHISFDNNLLAGTPASIAGDQKLMIKQNYDMLVESRAGAGVDTYTKGFKLDAHLKATLGPGAMKTGDGAFAPDLYKAGKHGELISYCLADVHRERLLFEHVWSSGNLGCEHKGGVRHGVRRPQEMLGLPMSMRIEEVRNVFPRVGGGPHIIGVDMAKAGESDRTVETKVCHCGKVGDHAEHVAHALFKLLNEPAEAPLVALGGPEHGRVPARPDTTNPEDL
jgi:hypothetical protein